MRYLMESVPQLQRLGVFEAAGRLGSFTAAARELGISQPAVSRHIGVLETQLGQALFDRRVNQIELTAQGLVLHQAVETSFNAVESALQSMQETNTRFVIAAQPSTAQAWITPRLELLRQRLDPCALSIVIFDREDELNQIDYDVAIRAGTGNWQGSRVHQLVPERVVPVTAPELAAQLGLSATSSAEDLLRSPLLAIDRIGRPWMSWQQWFAFQGIRYAPTSNSVEYDSYSTLMNEAIAGNGITLSWHHLRGNYVERGLLVEVGSVVHNPASGHYLVWPPALDRDFRVRALRDFLSEAIPRDPAK